MHCEASVHRRLLDPPERFGLREAHLLVQQALGPVNELAGLETLDKIGHLGLESDDLGIPTQSDLDRGKQVVGGEGLDYVSEGARFTRALNEFLLAERGKKHDRCDVVLAETLSGRDSIELGHLDIHDHEIRTKLGGEGNSGLAVACFAHDLEAVVTEDLDDVHADERLILGNDDPAGGGGWGILVRHGVEPTVFFRALLCAGLAEWQTRSTQNALSERACGFKSHIRHSFLEGRGGTMTWVTRLRAFLLKQARQPQPRTEYPPEDVLAMLTALGIGMLETGQPTNVVRDRLVLIADAYGMPGLEVVALPTSLTLRINDHIDIASSTALGSRLDQAGAIDSLVEAAERAELDPPATSAEVARIRASLPRFGWFATLLGTVLLTIGFGLMLNPTAAALPAYLQLGALVGGLLILATRIPTLATLVPILSAFLVTLATVLYLSDAAGADALHVIAPALISFLPGLTITIAAMELTNNQVVAGASRLVFGVAQLLLLVFGVLAATVVTGTTLATGTSDTLGAWAPWVGVILVGAGYVLQQSAPRGSLVWILLALCVAYGVQSLVANTVSAELSGFAAAAVVVPFAELASRFRTSPPARVMTLATFWMLVPGSLGFIGLDEATTSGGGLATITSTAVSLLAIGLGVLVGTGFTVESSRLRRRLRRR